MPDRLKNLSKENLRLRQADVVFGEVEYAPGGGCGPRTQQDYQLVILHEGTLQAEIGGASAFVGAGQAILLHPGRREHLRFAAEERTRHSWCAVRPSAVPPRLRQMLRPIQAPFTWTPHLEKLFATGTERGLFAAPDSEIEASRFLYLALLLMVESLGETRRQQQPGMDRRLEKMQQFIAREYQRPLLLADLARSAGLSKQHLGKICRKSGQPAPLLQLSRQRLTHAADLLLHTGLSIKEISEQCGFQDPFHFSRKFKEWSRLSPRAYRQRTNQEPRTPKPG